MTEQTSERRPVALVTGASRGIGRSIATALARAGYHVLVNFLSRADEAEKTLAALTEAGGTGELLPFDVGSASESAEATTQAMERLGPIDVLVNNAGVRKDELLMWTTPESWDLVLRTDLTSFYNVTRPVVREMLLQRKGRIISISSTSGQTGLPGQVSYSAAKAGVIGASKALAREVGKRQITVNVVCPGYVETDILEGIDRDKIAKEVPLRRLGKPEEIAATVVFLCTVEAGYITGAVINVNGGAYM